MLIGVKRGSARLPEGRELAQGKQQNNEDHCMVAKAKCLHELNKQNESCRLCSIIFVNKLSQPIESK